MNSFVMGLNNFFEKLQKMCILNEESRRWWQEYFYFVLTGGTVLIIILLYYMGVFGAIKKQYTNFRLNRLRKYIETLNTAIEKDSKRLRNEISHITNQNYLEYDELCQVTEIIQRIKDSIKNIKHSTTSLQDYNCLNDNDIECIERVKTCVINANDELHKWTVFANENKSILSSALREAKSRLQSMCKDLEGLNDKLSYAFQMHQFWRFMNKSEAEKRPRNYITESQITNIKMNMHTLIQKITNHFKIIEEHSEFVTGYKELEALVQASINNSYRLMRTSMEYL